MGNILTANGHTYTYGNADWKDLLTAYDGETISYDASGNPTSYYNGTRWTFTWNNGRSLTRAVSGSTSVDYTYDLASLRTSKTVGDVAHKYFYAGSKLMRETYGSNTLDFFYDANGMPYALKHNGTIYYYITNLQGDVMQIVDASGNSVASYEYDPYGKVISATGTLAETNPIRYRGYYFDAESGLYYLQSRYYDPSIGRFLNADAFASTGQGILGYNMFAYCGNVPVNYLDGNGMRREHFEVSAYNTGVSIPETTQEPVDYTYELAVLHTLEANGIAFYNGVPVVRGLVDDNAGFSAGIIFLGNSIGVDYEGASVLRHEYGHVLHLGQIGWESYIVWVIIPSVTNYFRVPYAEYYSQPWEYIADSLGGVVRTNGGVPYTYAEGAEDRAQAYWQFTYDYVGVFPNG